MKKNREQIDTIVGNFDVAVKTHIESVCVTEFKALLCELKIQSYLEKNDYVVKFLGACTQNIKKRIS